MGYVESVLKPDEQVLAIGRMHWIVYLRGLILAAIGLILILAPVGPGISTAFAIVGAIVMLFGLWSLAGAWIEQMTTEIAVTSRRVIQKRGLIRRQTGEMNMEKVESVIVDQSILGRIFGYGSIVVRGTGSGIEGLHFIADPIALRSSIVVR
ncbi:PH domain-containing protein [Devosia sp. LjRoot16]|uniref:PH domain-containing protein n=1 Tax=Devosia sp. LjRoot16 TaxID=3342271 RepID=UPI003ED12CB6